MAGTVRPGRDRDGHPPATAVSPLLAAGGPVLLLLAALVPGQRPAAAAGLALGWLALRLGRREEAIAWAAVLPVAVCLPWPLVLGEDAPLGDPGCRDPMSVIALRRVALLGAVLAMVALLAFAHRSSLRELGLARPRAREAALALAGGLSVVAGGLLIGPLVARPFFGVLDFPVPPAALLPAVVFGLSNGVLEEVAYRGAMQGWLGRIASRPVSIGLPALAFGIVHAGPEVVALLPVHVALLAVVGLAGGLLRERTGTLAIPIGIHVGADVALYVGFACRAAAA